MKESQRDEIMVVYSELKRKNPKGWNYYSLRIKTKNPKGWNYYSLRIKTKESQRDEIMVAGSLNSR